MDKNDSFYTAAVKPTRIAITIYAIVKQIFVTLFISTEAGIIRFVINAAWLTTLYLVTDSKKLTKRQIAFIVLLTSSCAEIIFYMSVNGDRLITPFLIGCALLSIMYGDVKAAVTSLGISLAAFAFCIFVLGINVVGMTYEPEDMIFDFSGLVILSLTAVLIGKYTIGTLEKARWEAEAATRAKSNFLATMSHEIRTPMNAIMGITQIQLKQKNLPKEYEDALCKIFASSSSLLRIINDILDLSKIEAGRLELIPSRYDMPSLINDAVQFNAVRIGAKPIQFIMDVEETLPSALIGDELRLKQILNNLLSNAIKYTDKGAIKLTVRHVEKDGQVMLRFSVADSGQGMTPEDREKLFSEFQRFNEQANRTTEGTGLGLSITKRLVEMMDGRIEVESEYGVGSTFTVEVAQKSTPCNPIGAEVSKTLQNFTYVAGKERRHGVRYVMPYGRVLVVDDVETNLYVAKGLLAPYKLKIETVTSGFEAIDLVKAGNVYDIIFMDHMMPKMDGIETTQKLRQMGYGGTIIAFTANAITGNEEMFMRSGLDGFISKPIDVRHLDAALNKMIREKHPEEAKRYKEYTDCDDDAPPSVPTYGADEKPPVDPKMLAVFCRDAKNAVVSLRDTLSNGDVKLYTTTAHAMKSALANVGEKEASLCAQALEQAGSKGDIDFITANNEAFITALETLVKKLSPEEQTAKSDDSGVKEDSAYLVQYLKTIISACDDYDDAAAYKALDSIAEKPWKKITSAALGDIRDALFLHSDFEAAGEKAKMLLDIHS